MHERSLAAALIRDVLAIRSEHGAATAVVRVEVAAGVLSGVEPSQLADAFADQAETELPGAELSIQSQPLQARCSRCDVEVVLSGLDFRCSDCGGGMQVTAGDKLLLLSVTLTGDSPSLVEKPS